MPKYCNRGEVWPGWAATAWKRWIVAGVLRIPFGALAATYYEIGNSKINIVRTSVNKSFLPSRLQHTAHLGIVY